MTTMTDTERKVERLLAEGLVKPGERADAIAAFSQAEADDARMPVAAGTTSRSGSLENLYRLRAIPTAARVRELMGHLAVAGMLPGGADAG
jgi:hypothetical protein